MPGTGKFAFLLRETANFAALSVLLSLFLSGVPVCHGFTDALEALALGCFTEYGTCCRYVCAAPAPDLDEMVASLACAIRETAGNLDWAAEVGYLQGSGDYENIDEEYCFYISSGFEMACACDPTNPIENPIRGDTCGTSPPNFETSFDRGDFDCCPYETTYKVEDGWSNIGLPKTNDGCCPERVVSTKTDGNAEYVWPQWSCNLIRGYCCYDDGQTEDCRGDSTWKSACDPQDNESDDAETPPSSESHPVQSTQKFALFSSISFAATMLNILV